MGITHNNLQKSTIAVAISIALFSTANAQEKLEAEDSSGIEVISVTSQKRIQSIQDVGISLAAFNGDSLREQGINNPTDIDKVMPNFAVRNVGGGGVPVVIMRGIGLQSVRVNDSPTSSFFIDEVYQTSIASAEFSMYDLERLEVLMGPQGGLYGRNTIGGAIQIISAKPEIEGDFSGYADLGFGSFSTTELEFGVNVPVSDKSAMRISGRIDSSGDKDYYSIPDDVKHGESDRWGLRMQYLYQPTNNVDLLFKIHGGNDESELPLQRALGIYNNIGDGTDLGAPNVSLGLLNGLFGAGSAGLCQSVLDGKGSDPATCATLTGVTPNGYGLDGSDKHASATGGRLSYLENEWVGASLIANIDFDFGTLTSITAYDTIDYFRYIDSDSTIIEFQDIDYGSDISFYSQEFRLAGQESDSLNWIIGASVSHDEIVEDSTLRGGEGILPLLFGGGTYSHQDYTQETDAFSIYGHADYALASTVNLITELRYTDETKSFYGGSTVGFPSGFETPLIAIDDEIDFSAFSGKIGLIWRVDEQAMLFTNISRGFKTGGFFGGFATDPDQLAPFNEETILAYEVGFKSDLLDNTLRINGSAFIYDRQDVQLNAANPNEVIKIARLTNIGDVDTHGAELEVIWAATEDLTFQIGLGYTDAEIAKSDYIVNSVLPLLGSAPLEGLNLPNYSKFSSNFLARHEHELGNNYIGMLQLEYSYRSEQDLSLITNAKIEDPIFKEPAISLANVRYSISDVDEQWKILAYIDNALDEEYRLEARSDGLFGVRERYALGRTAGIKFTYNW
ncbi:TonB-dependent receptor [Colwellia psychrerythraea]|uniref:TonB-dependent receptor n=1 Tax=Colwellia psychrerythraea (strain 34H / ATCC BAA-681) TaxID=167879 RepID=Q47YV0_COLP3|nr:TonB-dependent receptor [Colwellia psychrerythraea]AAZ23957.1 TonB-dependent receptor [Colwellia psychrerythraea 34H]